jgi:small subunit ribosomal protein S1
VHLTEFSSKRVRKPDDAVALGQEVDVWVKEVDMASSRISLSMRKKASHPLKQLQPGDVLTGVVTSTADYGVFVDIGSDTEGLVHISEISSGFVQKPADVLKPGDAVEVRVKDVDLARERISLSMVGLANDIGLTASADEAATEPPLSPDAEPGAEDQTEQQERQPTVVELALRRALGETAETADAEAKASRKAPSARPADPSLGEIYERMLAEYRASKDES